VLARPHRLDDADGICLRVKGRWMYLYRAVDGTGQTIDFLLSATRDKKAAKRFFRQALGRENTRHPRTVVTDRLKSYPGAIREMKRDGELWRFTRHRRGQWLNNLVEQDHRRIKRRTGPMLGFQGFWTARRTLAGGECRKFRVRAMTVGGRRPPHGTTQGAGDPGRAAGPAPGRP
jgi:transposase, IS6 family